MERSDDPSGAAFANLEKAEDWAVFCNLAHGYIRSAQSALMALGDPASHGGIYSLFPIFHNLRHALELFLKGGRLFLGMPFRLGHDLQLLLDEYNGNVPAQEIRFAPELVKRVSSFSATPGDLANGTFGKYLHDKDGNLLSQGAMIGEEWLFRLLRDCEAEMVRVHILMIQRMSEKPRTDLTNPLNVWWEPEAMFGARCAEALRLIEQRGNRPENGT